MTKGTATSRGPRVLYLSYDGSLEPLGQSQILPYLRGLAARGASITLMSFERAPDLLREDRVNALREQLTREGIRWVPLRYHKRPTLLATFYDILVGTFTGWRLVLRDRIRVVHARSYVPALIAYFLKRLTGARFIFDMRGFWADERVAGGLWPSGGRLYRTVKRLERVFLRNADEIVTLTDRARDTIGQWPDLASPRLTVIPTCTDLTRFSPTHRETTPPDSPVFIYVGSLGTWYMLDQMLEFVEEATATFANARLLIVTRHHEEALEGLSRSPLGADRVVVAAAAPGEVAGWLAQAHAGLAFYNAGFAMQGTCPTKLAEYLAMGLPVIVNEAVGDVRALVGGNQVGVVLPEFGRAAYRHAITELTRLWQDPTLAARCRNVAESHFSLPMGVERYWTIYRRVA